METRGPTLTISPLSGALGAEIAHADLAQLDDAGFAAIHAAFLDHQMLVFRDQRLTPAEYAALAPPFGPPPTYPLAQRPAGPPQTTITATQAHPWASTATACASLSLPSLRHAQVSLATSARPRTGCPAGCRPPCPG